MGYENLLATDRYDVTAFNALESVNTGIDDTVRDVSPKNGLFLGYLLHENAAAVSWVQVFFKPASEVELGVTAPNMTIKIGSGESVAWDFYRPVPCPNGLSVAGTTTEIGSTTAGTAVSGVIYHK